MQSPMASSPLKQTSEIDWIAPLKTYIRDSYGDDPERYAEECATLNRLRQDMRGAGKDSAAGRDLLYRYYGQLELLDLRFPVDENHIKISFTWYDAFTHKPTSQYSLAFEKASIIFNISAVLSCHAANQNRAEDSGLKTAYHSFQASAGMFNYINENFLHAPSTDLSRETVKTLISITLAQAQEVFLEKQIVDGKKAGLLAKLASQAATLYGQAVEGTQENVQKSIFERVWLLLVQIKTSYMSSLAQYYQALADDDASSHGVAIARLQVAETQIKEASKLAGSFPSSPPQQSHLALDTSSILTELMKRHTTNVQEKLTALTKDNDFIYHQAVPAEASLSVVPKLPAAKAIPVSELYQGQDIQRIIGPDIFQRIVPMSVTESASLYDEEKAKLVRAEAERVEQANDEMAASLDYLKLPGSLNVLKGGMDQDVVVDDEFREWCEELARREPFNREFDQLQGEKAATISILEQSSKQLDLEENVCEKMRVKYSGDWTQQPSSRLSSTLRSDIRSYRQAIDQAAGSDQQLLNTSRQHEAEFEEMRSAGETDEADVLYQRAMIKAGGKGKSADSPSQSQNLLDEDYGEGGPTVLEQINKIEDLLKKLNLVKKDRVSTLKDLKEKVHTDDISNVLILNKKSIANHENKLFESELEKFRSHQNRLIQANHKQTTLLKELTKAYGDLLQDKRVRSEQAKYDSFNRQRGSVMTRYRKAFAAFNDLVAGLMRAQAFYSEMKETAENLEKNVETFVSNRREEGGQLLGQIERNRAGGGGGGGPNASNGASSPAHADRENQRLQSLMERMSVHPASSPNPPTSPPQRTKSSAGRAAHQPQQQQQQQQQQPPPRTFSQSSQSPHGYGSPPQAALRGSPAPFQPGYATPQSYSQSSTPQPPHPYAAQGYEPTQYPYQQRPPSGMPQGMPQRMHPQTAMSPQAGMPPQGLPPGMQQAMQQQGIQQQGAMQPMQQQQQHAMMQQHGLPPHMYGYGYPQPGLPQGYVPPPPPPGPPPPGQAGYGMYAGQQQQQQQHAPPREPTPQGHGAQQPAGQGDPWSGLGAWK